MKRSTRHTEYSRRCTGKDFVPFPTEQCSSLPYSSLLQRLYTVPGKVLVSPSLGHNGTALSNRARSQPLQRFSALSISLREIGFFLLKSLPTPCLMKLPNHEDARRVAVRSKDEKLPFYFIAVVFHRSPREDACPEPRHLSAGETETTSRENSSSIVGNSRESTLRRATFPSNYRTAIHRIGLFPRCMSSFAMRLLHSEHSLPANGETCPPPLSGTDCW